MQSASASTPKVTIAMDFHLTKLMVYPIILSAPTKKIDSTSVGFFQSVLDLQRIFMTTRERVVT